MSTSPLQQDVFEVLTPFVQSVTGLGSGLVVQGLANRVPMPEATPGFVVLTSVGLRRLRWDIATWDLNPSDPPPTELSLEQGTAMHVQVDFYGPSSQDWAVAFQTLWNNEVAVDALAPTCAPLYCIEARMMPLEDSEQQYEQRWTCEAVLQYNPVTTTDQQFADSLTVTDVNVDQAFKP